MAGDLDFAQALRERVATLQGLPATVVDKVIGRLDYTSGGKTLVATMAA